MDRKAAGRLGGRSLWDARDGHPAHVRTVPHRRPQGGVQGASGSELSQPGALKEDADGCAVDHVEGDRGRNLACIEVYKDWPPGAWCKAPP